MKHDRITRPFDVRKIGFKSVVDAALGARVPGMLGVRAVGEERQDTAIAVGGERVKVKGLTVDGCRIDLEVACMDDRSCRSLNGKSEGVHDGVGHVEELHFERAELDDVFRLYRMKLVLSISPCCSSLFFTSPIVKLLPYTGTFRYGRMNGSAPI